jgi:acetolactate synthase-1/2/3 large subunit
MKASDYIAKFLELKDISHVFELPGGMITHLLDSIAQTTKIKIVTMHHEQAAAFSADAFARVTGKPGVALATSGPGATNLLTGIGSCYFDSVPAVFITGQVNINEQKGSKNIRQLGFQETDIVAMALPITKSAIRVTNAEELPEILENAFELALSGRQGPVLIDVPMNIQRAEVNEGKLFSTHSKFISKKNERKIDSETFFFDICNSSRPLILVGRGVSASFSQSGLGKFVDLTGIPVVTSLLGLDAIPFSHPKRVGFIGSYGNRWANLAIGNCDVLIVLGSRLDIRQTGSDIDGFKRDKKIYHIDIDSVEINNRVPECIPIVADVKEFLEHAIIRAESINFPDFAEWLSTISELRDTWPDTNELRDVDGINPNIFIHKLSKTSLNASSYIADVGNHQMWAAQSLELNREQLFLTSAGLGSMGYALPASIGACLGGQLKPVVCISGDGGFQVNIQELQTIVRNKLPVKIVIINNKSLGMIRQFQDSYFESRYQSTLWGYDAPDFEKVAVAYGIHAATISEVSQIDNALEKMWMNPMEPFLLQVMVSSKANAYPKIAFGRPITEMEPYAKPLDMEGT